MGGYVLGSGCVGVHVGFMYISVSVHQCVSQRWRSLVGLRMVHIRTSSDMSRCMHVLVGAGADVLGI